MWSLLAQASLDYREIIAIRMDRIVDDFLPFDVTVKYSGDTVVLPLYTGELMEVSLSRGVQWDRTFATQAYSSVMHLLSLDAIGRLLSTFQQGNEDRALQFAVVALRSFLDYSSEFGHKSSIGRIPSADHSAAIRVRVLIKFIQVMRERPDVDHALLIKVCDSLKFWSDWLSKPKHYSKNNHGLMGSIALLHSAVQFGATTHASTYLAVATNRIFELGKSSFDREGLCNENTIGYHNFNLKLYRGLVVFCKHYGLSETLVNFLEGTILRATRALEFCVWQDGSIPPLGDSAVYRTKTVSRNKPRCFFESGFAVVKNDALYLSIMCGAPTETHKQVDDSSITLRFMNRDILIDGGSYTFDRTDPYRRCVASSLGHSGVFLKDFDGLLRREYLRKFGPVSGHIERFEESDQGIRVKCLYSVRGGRAVFIRNIFVCWPDEVAIVDSVEVSDAAFSPETVQRFLFGPTLGVRLERRDKLILASDEFSCTLFQLLDCNADLYRGEDGSVVRGWFSKKYKEILPTYGVDFLRKSQMCRYSTIIKLAKCGDLSECSMTVRSFAGGADPFVSTWVRDQ
jgi:Heparinase II/III-like protein